MALESAAMTAGGPILLGILIGLGTLLKWPNWTNYLWGVIALV